jgi:nucleotide-binding universal stress UspA family protein
MMPITILAPLDGSHAAEAAMPYALRLAKATTGRLVLVRAALAVEPQGHDPAVREARATAEARAYLDLVIARLGTTGSAVETMALYGYPATQILSQSRRLPADLVVMATHARAGLGRWIFGSVADEIIRHASVPVLAVPHGSAPPWPAARAARILVTLDGSSLAEAVLGPVQTLAAVGRWRS